MKIINILRACREVPYDILLNRLFKIIIFVILFFITVINVSFAQNNYVFGPSIRVNDDPPGSSFHHIASSGFHGIACRGDTVLAMFSDERNGGNRAVYFSKSPDARQTWGPNVRVIGGTADFEADWASIALDAQGYIYITCRSWESGPEQNVYFTKSTDGGLTFSDSVLVNDTTRLVQQMPSIAVDSSGQKVYIAWEDGFLTGGGNPDYNIRVSVSTDGGTSFLPSVRVDDTGIDSSWQQKPSIGCSRAGDTVYVAWRDERNDRDVYFSRSIDGGQTFEPNIIVNDTAGVPVSSQRDPSIWVSKSGNIFIVWEDLRSGPSDIFFDKSTDGGVSFSQDIKVTDTLWGAADCSITADDSERIYIAWLDNRTYGQTGSDIYFTYSTDTGSTFAPNVRVNDLGGTIDAWDWNANIAVNSEGKVFVAWFSDRNDPTRVNTDIYAAAGIYTGIKEYINKQTSCSTITVYPNPYKNKVHITLMDTKPEENISIMIYDITGRCIKTIENILSNHIVWTGIDDLGNKVPAGVYFCHVKSDRITDIKKIIKID